MPTQVADTPLGGTLTLATQGGSYNFIAIGMPEESVAVIDVSHLGTTNFREKLAGDLKDSSVVTVRVQFVGIDGLTGSQTDWVTAVGEDDEGNPTDDTDDATVIVTPPIGVTDSALCFFDWIVKGPILVPFECGQITVVLRHTDRVAHHLMPHVAGSHCILQANLLKSPGPPRPYEIERHREQLRDTCD